MKRKEFLKNGSLAGLAFTSLAASAGQGISGKETTAAPQSPAADDFELNEITVERPAAKNGIRCLYCAVHYRNVPETY